MRFVSRVLSIFGILLLILVLLDFFIGYRKSVFISKDNGSLLYKNSVVIPAFSGSPWSVEINRRYEETAFSKFMGSAESNDSSEEWALAMYRIRGIISREIRVSPTPDLSKKVPINDWNQEDLLDFLELESVRNPQLDSDFRKFFSGNADPDWVKSFTGEINRRYADWKKSVKVGAEKGVKRRK